MSGISREVRRELWRRRMNRYASSDQTVADFCQQEQVSAPSFYYWKKRLLLSGVSTTRSQTSNRTGFAELELVQSQSSTAQSTAEATLPGGITIRLGSDQQMASTIVQQLLRHACGEAVQRC